MLGLGEEVELVAIIKLLLANLAPLEKRLACSVEGAVEHGEEDDGLFAEHSPPLVVEPAEDVDILQDLVGVDGRRHDGRYEEMGGTLQTRGGFCTRMDATQINAGRTKVGKEEEVEVEEVEVRRGEDDDDEVQRGGAQMEQWLLYVTTALHLEASSRVCLSPAAAAHHLT